MADAEKATKLVVGLLVMGLLAAFLMPVAINAMAGPETTTVTQDVDETVTLQSDLNATVTGVTDGTSATYTIEAGGDSVTGETVAVDSNSTVTVNGIDVTIAPTNATASAATTDYTYPTTYGWGGGAASLWAILPVIVVLGIFLFLVAMALKNFDF